MAVHSLDGWRLPGCGERCWYRNHDPSDHEQYGRLLERTEQQERPLRTGPLAIDRKALTVTIDGVAISLTPTERRLMMVLARRAEETVSAQELVMSVWGVGYLDTPQATYRHLLRTNIARLRRRLGLNASLIVAVPDIGYRLDVIAPGQSFEPWVAMAGRPITKWSRLWDACRFCGLNDFPHHSRGACSRYACDRQREHERKVGRTP